MYPLHKPLTFWAGSLTIKLPPEDKEPTAFIVICHDRSVAAEAPIFMVDVGIVAQTIMLRAAEDGFGGCIIGSAKAEKVSEALGLDDQLVPKLILALGRPDETVILTDAKDGDVNYYRDENNVHYAPPWRREWQPTPVFVPGEFHAQRSLGGYSPRSRKESDTTERLSSTTMFLDNIFHSHGR